MTKANKLSFIIFSLLLFVFSLSGCSANGEKNASFSLLYGTALFFSFVVPICYILTIKNKNPWIMLLFLCIITVNSGYLMLCLAKTLSFALWANRIAYLGSVFLPFCMLMSVLRLCNIKHKKSIACLLFALGFLVFFITASQGYSDIYYKSVSLSTQDGVSRLIKEYGPLHIIYLFYLLLYFIIMIVVMIYARLKGKLASTLRAIFLITAVFINITVWLSEQFVDIEFELLSFSYIISEAFLLGLALLIQENEKHIEAILKENSQKESPAFTEEEIDFFKKGINELTKTEKIIFDYYILGYSTKEIRERMNITENTLKYHNKNIYGKLGVTSRKQLVLINEFIQK